MIILDRIPLTARIMSRIKPYLFDGCIGAGKPVRQNAGENAAAIQRWDGQKVKDTEHQINPDAGDQGVIQWNQN